MMHRPITIYAFLTSSSSLKLQAPARLGNYSRIHTLLMLRLLRRGLWRWGMQLIIIHYFPRQIKAKPWLSDHFLVCQERTMVQNVNAEQLIEGRKICITFPGKICSLFLTSHQHCFGIFENHQKMSHWNFHFVKMLFWDFLGWYCNTVLRSKCCCFSANIMKWSLEHWGIRRPENCVYAYAWKM